MAKVAEQMGVLFQEKNFTAVKQICKKGEKIEKHNHPEANVLFTVVKGKFQVFIDEKETFLLEPGKVLNFDGDHFINADCLEDGEAVVTLILKN